MAEILNIGGQEFKKRSPIGAWLLSLTVVYYFIWYYKINDEARRYLGDETIKPGISLLAVLLGWVLIVPPFISLYRTGERIQRMQVKAGVQQQISPALFLLASFLLSIHILYGQEALNKIWTLYQGPAQLQAGQQQPGLPAQGTPQQWAPQQQNPPQSQGGGFSS
jgi:Domain of unknown function (DUF4234)